MPIKRNGETYIVPSQTNGSKYQVDATPYAPHCNCPDFEARQQKCKHIYAVEYTIKREESITTTASGETTVTKTETVKLRYNQMWPAYNSAQTNEKTRFLSLLYELCAGIDEPIQTWGRPVGAHVHDTNMFAPLVNSTARHFNVEEVSADKAYSNRANLRVAENKGIKPYIDFRKNTKPTGKVDVWHRMFHYYQMNREEFYQHYHKRSNVESTFSMIKAKFGGYLRSKTFTAQANEALCKILCHNLCCLIQSAYELGTEATFWAESDWR